MPIPILQSLTAGAGVRGIIMSPETEPDWGGEGDTLDATSFEGTPALHDDLEKEIGPATAGALLAGIEQQLVSQALLECE